ncbi:MAG: DUF3343 domain-containing protein [Spirochaetaceae bacterium]|nr:DUF3343 domain-containing protein [Spirochaetaceae bacterium]
MKQAFILTFPTTFAAIRAEKSVKAKGIPADLIPVPVEISSECGFCLRMPASPAGLDGSGGVGIAEVLKLASRLSCEATWMETTREEGQGSRREKHYEQITQNR